jgi:KDO2-lipid IV(A) lauroyltransferase
MANYIQVPQPSWLFRGRIPRQRYLRYWIRDPILGALHFAMYFLARLLPTDICSAFGATIVKLVRPLQPGPEKRARLVMRKLLPDADETSIDAMMDRLWNNVGRTMVEITVIDRMWAEGRIEVEGAEHLHSLRAAGRPILVAALHLSNWEVISVSGINLGYHGASLAIILENRFEQRLVEMIRRRFGGRMIFAHATAGMAIVRELRERGPMVIYIDEHIRGRVGAPAFGRPLVPKGNIAYVFRLAKLTGAAIVPVYCIRQNNKARFKMTIMPPVTLVETGDEKVDLMHNIAELNSIAEPIVQAHLDQWYYALTFNFDK